VRQKGRQQLFGLVAVIGADRFDKGDRPRQRPAVAAAQRGSKLAGAWIAGPGLLRRVAPRNDAL
jgi:hypothetical protein